MYEVRWTRDIVYDAAHPASCVIELCEPVTEKKVPLFIFFHGGGFVKGRHEIDPALASLAQERGIAVASVKYRLYPDARYPDYMEDAANAIAYLEKERHMSQTYSHIVVGGSSAGGYQSMMLCFAKPFLQNAGVDENIVSGWIFNAGQPTTHFQVLQERGLDGRCVMVDDASPLYYIRESYKEKRTVPVLFLLAEHDIYNRLEQNMVMKNTLLHFDYPAEKIGFRVMEGYGHIKYDEAQDSQGNDVFAEIIADFIGKL